MEDKLLNKTYEEIQDEANKEYTELFLNMLEWNNINTTFQDEENAAIYIQNTNGMIYGAKLLKSDPKTNSLGIIEVQNEQEVNSKLNYSIQTPSVEEWYSMTEQEKLDCVKEGVEIFAREEALLNAGKNHEMIEVIQGSGDFSFIDNEKDSLDILKVLQTYEENFENFNGEDNEYLKQYYATKENNFLEKNKEYFEKNEEAKLLKNTLLRRNDDIIKDLEFTRETFAPSREEAEKYTLADKVIGKINASTAIKDIGGAEIPREFETISPDKLPEQIKNFQKWISNAPDLIKNDIEMTFKELSSNLKTYKKEKEFNNFKEKFYGKISNKFDEIAKKYDDKLTARKEKRANKLEEFRQEENGRINRKIKHIENKLKKETEREYAKNEYIYKTLSTLDPNFKLTDDKIKEIKNAIYREKFDSRKIKGQGLEEWRKEQIKEIQNFVSNRHNKIEKNSSPLNILEKGRHFIENGKQFIEDKKQKLSEYSKQIDEEVVKSWNQVKEKMEELNQKIEQSKDYLSQNK